jgi:hypothetical protein
MKKGKKQTKKIIPVSIGDRITYNPSGPWFSTLPPMEEWVASFDENLVYTTHGIFVPRSVILSAEKEDIPYPIRY